MQSLYLINKFIFNLLFISFNYIYLRLLSIIQLKVIKIPLSHKLISHNKF
jgi:hypothetical protein